MQAIKTNHASLMRVHVIIADARNLIINGGTLSDAMIYASGMCEQYLPDNSPFQMHGFATALATAFSQGYAGVSKLIAALDFDGTAWTLDTRKLKIVTNAGVIYIAPVWAVQVYPNLERFAGYWDMRTGLIRNEQYFKTINPNDIKAIEYV